MKKQNVRTISLIVCTFTYLLVGAAVFDALESDTEKKRWEALNEIESMLIRKYSITAEDFKVMETVVLKSEPHKAGQQWKFTGAFYYATTVLTTIGYGHSTPSTVFGKLFTMCYAIVGIPLGLVMFQSIGERVNRLSSFVIRNVKSSLHCRHTTASELDLICVVTTLSSLTIAGGAAAFSRFEGWSYFDSVYYCFITLTTIGFGDMVALQKDNALNKKPEYVMFALIFILFGLAIVAASLNLLVLRFVTMNTEDERRDEAQAMQALQVAVRLEGDVITANGSILSGHIGLDSASLAEEKASICSCHCGCFRASRHKSKHKYKTRRSPSRIRHLLTEPPNNNHHHQLRPTYVMPMHDFLPPPIEFPDARRRRTTTCGVFTHYGDVGSNINGVGGGGQYHHRGSDAVSELDLDALERRQQRHRNGGTGGCEYMNESRTQTTLLMNNQHLSMPELPPQYHPQCRASI